VTTVRIAYRVGDPKRWEWRLTLPCDAIEAPAQIAHLESLGYLALEVGETTTELFLPTTWNNDAFSVGVVNTYGEGYCRGERAK
jgi:hypothetical protein